MESVRPVTAITGSNKFRALRRIFEFPFFRRHKAGFCRFWIVARRSRLSPRGRQLNSFRKRSVCLVRASRRRDLNVKGPQRAETAPISVARQGPLTCPLATFAVAICNGSKTSTPAFIADVDLCPESALSRRSRSPTAPRRARSAIDARRCTRGCEERRPLAGLPRRYRTLECMCAHGARRLSCKAIMGLSREDFPR